MSINNFDSPSQQCTDTSANITRLVRQQLIREVVSLTIRDTQHRLRKENISILCYGCEVLPVIALHIIRHDAVKVCHDHICRLQACGSHFINKF